MSAVFSYLNFADDFSFSAIVGAGDDGDAAPGIPGSIPNLLNMQRKRKWVGPTAPIDSTTNAVEIDFAGTFASISLFAVLDTDFDPVADSDIELQYKNTSDVWVTIGNGADLGGAGAIDTLAPHLIVFLATPVTAKAMRLLWTGNASPNNTISASRFWAGQSIDVSKFFGGFQENVQSNDHSAFTNGRHMYSDLCERLNKNPTIVLDRPITDVLWGLTGVAPETTLVRMLEQCGQWRDVIFCPSTDSSIDLRRTMIYGTISNNVRIDGLRPAQISIQMQEL